MEVRVTKMPEGNFVPEYKDEGGKFGPQWRECHLDNNLVVRKYWKIDEAQYVCHAFAEKYKKEHGEVVWSETL